MAWNVDDCEMRSSKGPYLIPAPQKQPALQKTANGTPKHGLLQAERAPFGTQKVCFCKAVKCNMFSRKAHHPRQYDITCWLSTTQATANHVCSSSRRDAMRQMWWVRASTHHTANVWHTAHNMPPWWVTSKYEKLFCFILSQIVIISYMALSILFIHAFKPSFCLYWSIFICLSMT